MSLNLNFLVWKQDNNSYFAGFLSILGPWKQGLGYSMDQTPSYQSHDIFVSGPCLGSGWENTTKDRSHRKGGKNEGIQGMWLLQDLGFEDFEADEGHVSALTI